MQPAVSQLTIDSKRAGSHGNEVSRLQFLELTVDSGWAVTEAYKQQEQRRSSHTSTRSGSGIGSGNGSMSGEERTPKIGAAPFSDVK